MMRRRLEAQVADRPGHQLGIIVPPRRRSGRVWEFLADFLALRCPVHCPSDPRFLFLMTPIPCRALQPTEAAESVGSGLSAGIGLVEGPPSTWRT